MSWLFFTVSSPVLFICGIFSRQFRAGLGERLGFLEKIESQGDSAVRVWLHAASVGEVQLANALIQELVKILPEAEFVVSTMTVQGREMAVKQLGPGVRCIYAPLDLAGVVGRVVRILKPSVYICLETELWPNIIRALNGDGVRLILLNGRLSERSQRRYRLIRGFMKIVLANFSMISVIGPGDAARYIDLGADPERVVVSGNAKYDLAVTNSCPAVERKYRGLLGLAEDQPLLVSGSTHTGEEKMLLRVFQDLKKEALLHNLVWVVAPRHLRRLPEVEDILQAAGIEFQHLSQLAESARQADVVIVDGIGELAGLYSAATYVFCGGSLVPRGGHNIMEAAVYGKPVFYGRSMKDFADAAALLESVKAGFPVAGPAELTSSIRYFINHPEAYRAAANRARETAMAQQGSAAKQARLAVDLLAA